MRRVSYQSVLGEPAGPRGAVYVRLGEGAIATKRKAAIKDVTVQLSKAQHGWLREVLALTGPEVDDGAVLRALVDLGMELDIDWAVLASGKALRAAVRESVMVRRRGTAG